MAKKVLTQEQKEKNIQRTAHAREASRKIKSEEWLREKINDYFTYCEATERIPTEHALANKLGVTRDVMFKWVFDKNNGDAQYIKEYIPILKEAYDHIADEYVQLLHTGDKNMTSFVIFALKQLAFGAYQDKIENKNETTVKVQFGDNIEVSDFK